MFKLIVIFFVLTVSIHCDDIDLNGFKPTLSQFLTNHSNEVDEFVREKCSKASATTDDAAFDQLKKVGKEFLDVYRRPPKYSQFQEEFEAAKENGDSKTAVVKYCDKHKELLDSTKALASAISQCQNEEEKKTRATVVDYYNNLFNFFCASEGNNFAMFLNNKGDQCFTDKSDAMRNCTIPVASKFDAIFEMFPIFAFDERTCDDFDNFGVCMATEAKKCEEKTTANMLEDFFKFMRDKSPCAAFTNKQQQNS